MLEIVGITEIVGESGTGKTSLALFLKKELKTLYISIYSINPKWFDTNVIPIRIDSFLKLKVFIINELKDMLKNEKIQKIILDGLEDYLYVFESPRKQSMEVFKIMKILRSHCFKNEINVIVINGSYSKFQVDGVEVRNPYIGLPWEYMINRRYLLIRSINDQRIVSCVLGKEKINKIFNIKDLHPPYKTF